MLEFFRKLFRSDFMPHGHCYFWQPSLVWLHVSSDLLIALSYFLIPLGLVQLVRKRRDLEFHWMFVLFGIFILSCGLTHVLSVYNIWHSAYRLEGLVKGITAASSVVTAILLFPLVPRAISLPSPAMLQKEVDDRRSAELEILRLNSELETRVEQRTATLKRANDALKRFSYIASHDLQEPIRTVRLYNQLLVRDYSGKLDERASQFLGFAVEAAGRMQQLVTDLMAYACVVDSEVERTRLPLQPAEILDDVTSDMTALLQDSEASISWDSQLPLISADRIQIKQVFQNLIANAIKYRRPDEPPQIRIAARLDGRQCTFAVSDNGIGIAERYFQVIFIAFKRLHGKEYPGSGVGLTICRNIVEEHGGRIWVESEVGRGATFYFTLPSAGTNSLSQAS